MTRLSLLTAVSALVLAACGPGQDAESEPMAPEGDAASHSEVDTGHGPETPARGSTETASASQDSAEPDPAYGNPTGDAGAGQTGETAPDQAAADETPAMSQEAQTILAGFGAPYTQADLENGERVFRRCAACHTLPEGARNLVGPNLHGVFGREAGTVEGFRYSDAVQNADFEWTPDRLEEWLANPREFLPGNRMAFPGLRDEQDRHDVIAYLAVETHAEPVE